MVQIKIDTNDSSFIEGVPIHGMQHTAFYKDVIKSPRALRDLEDYHIAYNYHITYTTNTHELQPQIAPVSIETKSNVYNLPRLKKILRFHGILIPTPIPEDQQAVTVNLISPTHKNETIPSNYVKIGFLPKTGYISTGSNWVDKTEDLAITQLRKFIQKPTFCYVTLTFTGADMKFNCAEVSWGQNLTTTQFKTLKHHEDYRSVQKNIIYLN